MGDFHEENGVVICILRCVNTRWLKALCDSKSPIFKLWKNKVPEIYSATYLATCVVGAFQHLKIGVAILAAGVAAIAMQCGAQEFCEVTKPDSIVDTRRKKR